MDRQKLINDTLDFAAALAGIFPKKAENFHIFENYGEYLKQNTADAENLRFQHENPLNPSPLVSVTVVCKNGCADDISRTVFSLLSQTYTNWEVCIAADVKTTGSKQFENIENFRLVFSAGSEKELLKLAGKQLRGAYYMLLEAGDILSPDALYEMMQVFSSAPDAEFVYTDEDSINPSGERCNPVFKPDCEKETILSYNCVGKPFLNAKRVHNAIGGFIGTAPNDFWEYALKAFSEAKRTVHIARIGLSSAFEKVRTLPDSFDMAERINKISEQAKLKPISESLPGSVQGTCRQRCLMKKHLSAGIIISNPGNARLLQRCIESIQMQSEYDCYRIFVEDDGTSDEEMKKYLSALEHEKVISTVRIKPGISFPAGLNYCAKYALSEMLVFLNGGCEILTPDFLEQSECFILKKGIGAVGGKLVDQNNNILSAGTVIGLKGWTGSPYDGAPDDKTDFLKCSFADVQRNVSAVSGLFMAVSGEAFFSAGLFDESFTGVGWDTELCIRLRRRGLRICFNPYAKAQLTGTLPDYAKASSENLTRCYDCLRETLIQGDGFFNANFDPASAVPKLAVKPYPAIMLNQNYNNNG